MNRLSNISLFRGPDLDLAPFEARVRCRTFQPDEVLLDFDDDTSEIYFLVAGEVRVLIRTKSGKEVILGEMRSGGVFGELAALDGIRRSANVTALTRGEVCTMSAATFRQLVLQTPVVADRLFRLLTGRIRELDARIMEHTVLDLRHRLYSEMLRLSIARPSNPGERVITPPPYHHVLAARIGCRREQVTREFTIMDADGLIERTRGALILKKPELLQSRISAALREE